MIRLLYSVVRNGWLDVLRGFLGGVGKRRGRSVLGCCMLCVMLLGLCWKYKEKGHCLNRTYKHS